MKKLLLFFGAIALLSFSVMASNPYKVDEARVDQLFADAQEISLDIPSAEFPLLIGQNQESLKSAKDPWIAFIVCTVAGTLGIHRLYLGTKGTTVLGYILTAGGCGIVTTVDWFVLLFGAIDEDIKDYVDNPKFFMWM